MNFRDPVDVENERVEKLKDLEQAEINAHIVRCQINRIEKCILVLGLRKKDLKTVLSQGQHNIRVLRIQCERLKIEFFRSKP